MHSKLNSGNSFFGKKRAVWADALPITGDANRYVIRYSATDFEVGSLHFPLQWAHFRLLRGVVLLVTC
jgi:hypothetical protein